PWTLLRESLAMNEGFEDKRAVAFVLEDFAAVAAAQGRARRALRLVGAANAVRDSIGTPLAPVERERLEHLMKPAEHVFDARARSEVETAGRGMSLGDAVAYALGDTD